MIKRPTSQSAPISLEKTDHNGKEKYQRHGSIVESTQRWMARNGKSVVIFATFLILSVFLIPPLKVILKLSARTPTTTQPRASAVSNTATATTTQHHPTLQIPPCPTTPWKTNENLQGKCPGDLKPYKEAPTLSACAASCCANPDCIAWQYRQDVKCLQGKDIRLGQEKDGPAAWCSDHPPHRWQGQYIKPHGDKHKGIDEKDLRTSACSEKTWNPNEEIGQCFGLGDVKKVASGSAKECMMACCEDEKCGAWQWNKELGCFYGGGMHSCQGEGDPIKFEPFIGRRKHLDSRQYKDKHGKPWQMAMS